VRISWGNGEDYGKRGLGRGGLRRGIFWRSLVWGRGWVHSREWIVGLSLRPLGQCWGLIWEDVMTPRSDTSVGELDGMIMNPIQMESSRRLIS
jgi:hypothetical protein